jgi:hypothetical protein
LVTAPVTEVTKSGEEKPLEAAYAEASAETPAQSPPLIQAQVTRPPSPIQAQVPATAVTAQVQPPATVAQTPSTELLPATGSPIFAIGFGGLLIAALGFGLRHALLQRS